MKKILFFALVALTLQVFFSCEDKDNSGEVTTEVVKVPETPAQAAALVNAVYGPLQTLSSSYSFFLENATETTVCFEDVDGVDGPQISEFLTNDNNWYVTKIFNRLYSSIYAANTAIDQISQAESANVDTQDSPYAAGIKKETLIARAKFIRGYDYFQLVQFFGEVPIITSYQPAPTDEQKTTRRTIDEVYTQAVTDLEEAIPNLPQYSSDKSVPSALAAKAILSKIYLTWGQHPLSQSEVETIKTSVNDPAKPAPDNTKLAKAIAFADEVISSGQYSLKPDFNTIWGVGNENNEEVIFSIHHDGDGIDAQGNHQTHCGYTWPKDERADPHIQWADISFESALSDGDTRKLYSYATYVSFSDGNIDTLTWPLSVVRPGKWIHRDGTGTINTLDNQPNNIDRIDFRLAEIYLVKAEAQYYSNSGDKGLAAVNKVRERATLELLSTVSEAAIHQEWQNEFAFEQKHWPNLIRWRKLVSSVKDNVPGYEYYKDVYNNKALFDAYSYNGIAADPSRFAFYSRIYKHLHSKVNNVTGKFYRFPIPATADDKSTALNITPQNPGF
ncbi:MAG: RagB/SusD family nutrient uptake outer membrane protein [Dysgonamonadaceae bacterium]|nr:RagB/SusD family nutrient uptake outer membrane protein [Dysgonamonadaceae bacterium]